VNLGAFAHFAIQASFLQRCVYEQHFLHVICIFSLQGTTACLRLNTKVMEHDKAVSFLLFTEQKTAATNFYLSGFLN